MCVYSEYFINQLEIKSSFWAFGKVLGYDIITVVINNVSSLIKHLLQLWVVCASLKSCT